jgi:hypothetical protein
MFTSLGGPDYLQLKARHSITFAVYIAVVGSIRLVRQSPQAISGAARGPINLRHLRPAWLVNCIHYLTASMVKFHLQMMIGYNNHSVCRGGHQH